MPLVGTSVLRSEDTRFLTGRARFVADVVMPDMLHASFLRSPYPHARIKRVDTSAALSVPGVVAVFTGADMQVLTNPMQIQAGFPGFKTPVYHPLAVDKVRLVGDPLALVVAKSRYAAEDGCDAIVVDYEPLPAVSSIESAISPGSPVIFEELGDNIVYKNHTTSGDVDAVFAEADRVLRETFRQHRYANVPIETRGGVASFDPSLDELTYYAATQTPHGLRFFLSNLIRQPTHRLHVVAGDVGGSFGLKWFTYREDVAICAASKQLGRTVKWIEDRLEHLTASGHAREETVEVEAAIKDDGTLLGIRAKLIMNQGAYPALPFPSAMFPTVIGIMFPGPYRLRAFSYENTVVASNKASYVAYRGPWEMGEWVRERLLDIIAHELDLDPVDVRRKNMITKEEQPTNMVTGPTLDRISARETLERAVELADYEQFREQQLAARGQGRYLGIGFATFIEAAPGPHEGAQQRTARGRRRAAREQEEREFATKRFPNVTEATPEARDNRRSGGGQSPGAGLGGLWAETARARLEPDGNLTVITAQMPHGQGHETTLAQVAADEMGLPFEAIKVFYGDTRFTPFSVVATGGSRSATMASGAVLFATRTLKERVLTIAAGMLEAKPADLVIENGIISVTGVPGTALPLAQVAMVAYMAPGMLPPGASPDLEVTFTFDGGEGGWSQATHCCWVDVDPETGQVRLDRFLVVEDCGTVINPAIVEGQVRGGVAQGIGGVLYEHAAYDDKGHFLAGTFFDYLLPSASEIPPIEVDHLETPAISPVNFRGVGESGAIGAPAAVSNAIADALAPLGVKITEQPLSPSRLLDRIEAAR